MKQIKKLISLLAVVAMPLFLLAQTSKNYEYYYFKGLEWSDSATAKHAVAMLDTALLLKPKDPDTYVARGNAKAKACLIKEALKDFDWAVANAKKNEKIKYVEKKEEALTGSASIRSVFISQKVQPFSQAIPSNKRAEYLSDADILDIFNTQISSYEDSPSVYIDRAGYYYRQEKYSQAITDLKKAIELSPTPFNFNLLACIMNLSKEYADRKILKVYLDGINKNFTDGWAYYYRAQFYESQAIEYKEVFAKTQNFSDESDETSNYNKAIADYEQAIDLSNNAFWYADLIRVKIEFKKSTVDEILNYYAKMLFLCNYGNKSEAYFARGDYYSSINQYKEGIADMDSSIQFGRDNGEAYLLRADLKDKLGTYGSADILLDLDNAKLVKDKPGYRQYKEIYDRLFSKYGKQ